MWIGASVETPEGAILLRAENQTAGKNVLTQTGYIVHSGGSQIDKHLFLNTSIQSNTFDSRDLLARIELFMQTFLRDINEMPEMKERFGLKSINYRIDSNIND